MTVTVPKAGDFTPEELVAMVLQHAVDISVAYSKEAGNVIPPPADIVLTVPSFYTHLERKALMDAAHLANLNVLGLIDETTAAALHYATDKNFEEEQVFLFYNMGSSSLQVSIVKFYQYEHKSGFGKPKPVPALQVLSKAWDTTLGGLSWDNVLVEYFADEFNKLWRSKTGNDKNDIRTVQRPMTKIRLAANKAKHVLSANLEYPVQLDALHDDISLKIKVTRQEMESLTESLLERAIQPVHQALNEANLTTFNLTGVELLGGGMRIPSIQTALSNVLKPIQLGLHMNADESMALGAAFAGANVSTAFRVRHVGLTDLTPLAQQITLTNLGEPMMNVVVVEEEEDKDDKDKKSDVAVTTTGWERKFQPYEESPKTKEGEEKEEETADEVWTKTATLFKGNSKIGVKKTIAFTHDQDVHCALDYNLEASSDSVTSLSLFSSDGGDDSGSSTSSSNTLAALERYEISGVSEFSKELKEKGLEGKAKVSLQFELTSSGITSLIKAEATMEETYTVEEEVEVDDEEEGGNSTNSTTTDDVNTTFDATTEEDKTEADKKDTTATEEETEKNESNETESNETDASNSTEEKAPEEKKKKKKFIQVQKVGFA